MFAGGLRIFDIVSWYRNVGGWIQKQREIAVCGAFGGIMHETFRSLVERLLPTNSGQHPCITTGASSSGPRGRYHEGF